MSPQEIGPKVEVLTLGEVHLPDWHPRSVDKTCLIQAFLIHHPEGPILVDTGVGQGNDLIEEHYRPTVVPIVDALNRAGVDERDLTAIVNTHLHFDHCGQNRALPSVPVYVQAPELVAAQVPRFTIAEWAHIEPERKRVIDGDQDIATGVRILATPGHTPGHQSVLVQSPGGRHELIVGQCCYNCAEFEAGEVDPEDLHDESYLDIGADTIERLRRLDIAVAYFSHDASLYRR